MISKTKNIDDKINKDAQTIKIGFELREKEALISSNLYLEISDAELNFSLLTTSDVNQDLYKLVFKFFKNKFGIFIQYI